MTPLLNMAAYGATFAVLTSILVSVTVTVIQPPPPPVPTADEIGAAVVRQYSEQIEAARQSAQTRKNSMRCGLPGYGECP